MNKNAQKGVTKGNVDKWPKDKKTIGGAKNKNLKELINNSFEEEKLQKIKN